MKREYGKPETWPENRIPKDEHHCVDEPCTCWVTTTTVREPGGAGVGILLLGLALIVALVAAALT